MHTHIITVNNIPMTIRELLNENRIEIGAELYSKDEALDELIHLQKKGGTIHNPRALKREIVERERKGAAEEKGCQVFHNVYVSIPKGTHYFSIINSSPA